jgi:hypothetical protein
MIKSLWRKETTEWCHIWLKTQPIKATTHPWAYKFWNVYSCATDEGIMTADYRNTLPSVHCVVTALTWLSVRLPTGIYAEHIRRDFLKFHIRDIFYVQLKSDKTDGHFNNDLSTLIWLAPTIETYLHGKKWELKETKDLNFLRFTWKVQEIRYLNLYETNTWNMISAPLRYKYK